jgi:hypothetical protein
MTLKLFSAVAAVVVEDVPGEQRIFASLELAVS